MMDKPSAGEGPGRPQALIAAIEAGSPADRAGLTASERIISANGEPLRDYIDWLWLSDGEEVELELLSESKVLRKATLARDLIAGEAWGIEFADVVFDGIRQCRNTCTFCFMRQLPEDSRPSLCMRDDDYRLSFLQGTFITLTNLGDDDIERIVEQHISPIRVSLHAMDPDVRRNLIGMHAQTGIDNLERLLDAGISFDAQIVLVPGVNDGDILDDTLEWAYSHPGIENVAVVPLGFTAHQDSFDKSYDDPADAAAVLNQLRPFQDRAMRERGCTWVYGADELYRNALGEEVVDSLPDESFYGEFEMFEDGVGIIRTMIDSFSDACDRGLDIECADAMRRANVTAALVCGAAMSPYSQQLVDRSALAGLLSMRYATNVHFGGNVNVTGLLSGADIASAIAEDFAAHAPDGSDPDGKGSTRIYLIPNIVFGANECTLDGMTLSDIRKRVTGLCTGLRDECICAVPSNPLDYIQSLTLISIELQR